MFEDARKHLEKILGKLTTRGSLSERDVQDTITAIRQVLVDSDVPNQVVNSVISRIRERAAGLGVPRPVPTGQRFATIVNDALAEVEQPSQVDEQAQAEKFFTGTFTMDDFLGLFDQMKKMGGVTKVLDHFGEQGKQLTQGMEQEDMEKQMAHTKAMILSMTLRERVAPGLINGGRARRIAKGSGTSLDDVYQLLQEFKQTRKMMKQVGKAGGLGGKIARFGVDRRKKRQIPGMTAGGHSVGPRRRVVCKACGAPGELARRPRAVDEQRGLAIVEVAYRCPRPGCKAPVEIRHVIEGNLSAEERKRWGRWR